MNTPREEWRERIDAAHAIALVMDDERENLAAVRSRVWGTNHYQHHLPTWRGGWQAVDGYRNDFHWRGGLFFSRLTCGCVMIYSEARSRRFADGSLSWDRTVIAVVPQLEWASIVAWVSGGARGVLPGAVVVDPKGEIPDAVVRAALNEAEAIGLPIRFTEASFVIRAALRAWPKGAA